MRLTSGRRNKVIALVVCLVGCCGLLAKVLLEPTTHLRMPSGVTLAEYRIAREAFEARYGRTAERIDVTSYLAELYLAHGRFASAASCFSEIPSSHPQYGRMARYQQGRSLLELHRAVEAEQQFRELIELEEGCSTIKSSYLIDARKRLRHILEVELRFEERKRLLSEVVRRGEADSFEVIVFCFPSHLRWNGPEAVKWLEEFHAEDRENRFLNIALGRYRMGQGRLEEANNILQEVVRRFPGDRWAMAAWIACLDEAGEVETADRAIESLPNQAPDDPWLLLLLRGRHALQRGEIAIAANAYDRLLEQDETNTEAWQKQAQLARISGDERRLAFAIEKATVLERIQNHIGKAMKLPDDPDSYLDIADLCAEIGLNLEGLILARFAETIQPQNPRAVAAIELFQSRQTAISSGDE